MDQSAQNSQTPAAPLPVLDPKQVLSQQSLPTSPVSPAPVASPPQMSIQPLQTPEQIAADTELPTIPQSTAPAFQTPVVTPNPSPSQPNSMTPTPPSQQQPTETPQPVPQSISLQPQQPTPAIPPLQSASTIPPKPIAQTPSVVLPTLQTESKTSSAISNGDNSKVNGDNLIKAPDSIQIVSQKETEIADNVKKIATAQTAGKITLQSSASSSQEGSYDQIRKLGQKIEAAAVPDELREVLNDRVARLALIRSGAGFTSSTYILEYESTSRYINWVVGLPWDKKTQDLLDLAKAKEILDKNHYGLDALKERVLQYIASIMLNVQNNGADSISHAPILCFVGLAGTGKTTFAKSVAEALGRQFERIPFGGLADSRVLRGQSRYFPDAEPGAIIKKLVHAQAKNPVILLDELDRVTESARSDIMGVLIELLDPEQNFAFSDHYIDYPFNLSNTLFIATANNTTAISTAVLDRLEIMQMPSYNDEEKTMIAKNYVFPKRKSNTGLKEDQLTIDDNVWESIIRPLGFDSGVRSLERTIEGVCRKAAELIVQGQAQNIRISLDNVKQFLPQW